jgi:hypothetical protein
MTKPRKALRSLFARTEPTAQEASGEDVTSHHDPIVTPPVEAPEEVVAFEAATPQIKEIVPPVMEVVTPIVTVEDVLEHHEPVVAAPVEEVAFEAVAPVEEVAFEAVAPVEDAPVMVASVEDVTSHHDPVVMMQDDVVVEQGSLHSIEMEMLAALADEPAVVASRVDFEEETIDLSSIDGWESLSAFAVDSVGVSVGSAVTPEAHNANVAAAVLNIQYNFEVGRVERETWHEPEYVEFIRRIDVAQAEAFFLKGKLLGEVKERFYVENRSGWKGFSENTLGMNYTTVNQYIRVAHEFDVTSHRRPDFGFEHYKALLPLKLDERTKLLEELPQVSVKELRNIVQRKLMEENGGSVRPQRVQQSKELIELLVDLKTKIFDCTPETMSQSERWQLTAACRNLADDLAAAARAFNEFGKPRANAAPRTNSELGDAIEAGV